MKTHELFEKCKEKNETFLAPEFHMGAGSAKFALRVAPLGWINSQYAGVANGWVIKICISSLALDTPQLLNRSFSA